MPDEISNSIVNIGDVTKPVDTFIKKMSKALGGLFAPYQTVRMAKADAAAALIKAQSEIQVTDLHRRAMVRFVEEEAIRQANIEGIAAQAIPQLNEGSKPEVMEDDWIANFFDKCRIVSDADMQMLWARILAGEANAPGTFSKRTVNFLSDLDKNDANLFTKLCNFGLVISEFTPLVYDSEAIIYNRNGITFDSLRHLESIGLIHFNIISGYKLNGLPNSFNLTYGGRRIRLILEKPNDNVLAVGKVLLTKTGQELAPICGRKPVDGFLDYLQEKWKSYLPGN